MSMKEKKAYFIDNNGNMHYTTILIKDNSYILMSTYNENNIPTGYMNIYFHPDNRLFLDTIYCYDEFRCLGIASRISELADYLFKDYIGYVIRGVYEPGQLSTDRENNIFRSKSELDKAARRFYKKNGYSVIDYQEYLRNIDKYKYITLNDFILGEEKSLIIVAKLIEEKLCNYYEENNIIYHNNFNKIKKM